MASKRRRRLLKAAAGLVITGTVAWTIPPVRARIKALGVLAEATDKPFPRPWARSVAVETRALAPGVIGDMYSAGDDSPLLLFVPGAARQGRDDPRVISAATALAQANRRVFVPELALYRRTFKRADIEQLVVAIESLSADAPVGIVAFSYGGSFALIAGSDARVANAISFIATFGAYFDLAHVIQGVTTGSTILDGEEVPFETVPEARDLVASAAVRLADNSYRDELEAAVEEEEDSAELGPRADSVFELLTNDDPDRTEELAAELPAAFRNTLDYFSPSSHIDGIEFPVFIMQSKKDAATPWPEALLLDRALPRSRVALLHHFSHVDPPSLTGWLSDGPEAWRFVSWILAEQE